MKKTVGATTVALAVSAGTVAGVYAYQSGNHFTPDAKERDLKTNQVSFSDNTDLGKNNEEEKKDKSALWEKDQKARESERPTDGEDPSYLFENLLPDNQGSKDIIGVQNDQENIPEPNNAQNTNTSNDDQKIPDEILDIFENESDADIRIDRPADSNTDNTPGTPSEDNGDKSDTNGDKDDANSGNNGGNGDKNNHDKPSESESPDTPSESESTDKPGKPDTSVKRPADTAKDPEVVKPKPGIADITNGENYNENVTGGNNAGREWMAVVTQSVDETSALYKGKSVDAYMVYCALDTYVMAKDDRSKSYIWGADAYNKYIRVDAISFDGGQTWENNFPVMIPEDLSQNILIKVSYRLKMTDAWSEMNVIYAAKDSRVFILSKALEIENETINKACK